MSRQTTRRTRSETADLVREAAVRLLKRDGLRGFSNSVRLDDALALLLDENGVRLTHGSVYGRIWDDQRDFQLDVVATTVARYDGADVAEAMTRAAEATTGTAAEKRLAAAFSAAVEAARLSRMWNLWLGAHAAVVSTPGTDDDERLAAALASARTQVAGAIASALSPLIERDQVSTQDLQSQAQSFLTLLVGASITRHVAATTEVLLTSLAFAPPANVDHG